VGISLAVPSGLVSQLRAISSTVAGPGSNASKRPTLLATITTWARVNASWVSISGWGTRLRRTASHSSGLPAVSPRRMGGGYGPPSSRSTGIPRGMNGGTRDRHTRRPRATAPDQPTSTQSRVRVTAFFHCA
jgi:hypothetical protein